MLNQSIATEGMNDEVVQHNQNNVYIDCVIIEVYRFDSNTKYFCGKKNRKVPRGYFHITRTGIRSPGSILRCIMKTVSL